jgi:hypothetical protein
MPWYRMRQDVADGEAPGVPNLGGAMVHIKVSRRRGGLLGACRVCGYIAERLCDWKKGPHASGESPTCDLQLCRYCTTSPAKKKNLCPQHALQYRAWLAGRTNSTDGAGPGADSIACAYCQRPARLVDGTDLYPRRPDLAEKMFWKCAPCDAWVGCHPGTTKPLGRLADAELRAAKQRVHALLDPIWKARELRRKEAYKMLAAGLGISKDECHVGMFDVPRCEAAVLVLKDWRRKNAGARPAFG